MGEVDRKQAIHIYIYIKGRVMVVFARARLAFLWRVHAYRKLGCSCIGRAWARRYYGDSYYRLHVADLFL